MRAQATTKINEIAARLLGEFLSDPVVVQADDPVSEILGKIASKGVNEVLVHLDSRFGVISLRSILQAGEMSERKASTLAVTPPIITPNDVVSKAARIMSNLRVRSLPVVDSEGKMQGAVSLSRILHDLSRSGPRGEPVTELMTPRPITVSFTDSLDKAKSLMIEGDFDHLPVIRDHKLAGLITSLDIVNILGPTEKVGQTSKLPEPTSRGSIQVGGALRGPAVTSAPDEDALVTLRRVLDQGRTCSTVVLGDLVQGIVTLRDYAGLLAIEPSSTGQPIYVIGLPEDDIESPLAEAKFRRSIEALGHAYPGINEARAVVKTTSLQKDRRRFEVHVLVRTSGEQFDFTEEGWSVAEVFENVGAKMKRLVTKPKNSPSYRKRLSREEMETSRYSE